MFERFTEEARRVLVLAQEESRMLDHNYIGTEHILLGLIHEGEGAAARALASLGISLEGVRDQVEEIIGRGQAAPSGHIPFTPRAKKVLELSLREALQLGHDDIGSEHLLLGLIREGEGVAAQVLDRLGATTASIRRALGEVPAQRRPGGGAGDRPWRRWMQRRSRPAGAGVEQWLEPDERFEPWPVELFDDQVWAALSAARAGARERRSPTVDARDLLLGVASVAGPGADALAAVGGSVEAFAAPRPDDPPADPALDEPGPALAFTDTVRAALVWACEEAHRRSHRAVGTGHVLLALLIAAREDMTPFLETTDVDRRDLHGEVGRRLA